MVTEVADSERPAPKGSDARGTTAVEREFASPGFFRDMAEILWNAGIGEVVKGPMPTSDGEMVYLPLVEGDRHLRVARTTFNEEAALQRHLFDPWSEWWNHREAEIILANVPLQVRQEVADALAGRGRGRTAERDDLLKKGEVFLPTFDPSTKFVAPAKVVIPAVRRAWRAWQDWQAEKAAARIAAWAADQAQRAKERAEKDAALAAERERQAAAPRHRRTDKR